MSDTDDRPDRTEPFFSQEHPAERPEDDASGLAASEPDVLTAALARIAALEAEIARLKDQNLRVLAEAENSRRRLRKDAEEVAKYALGSFAKELLEAPDNLRRTLDSIPPEGLKQDALLERLASGVEMVERELGAIFERNGIKRIDPLGQPFDHNLHQAVFEVPTAEKPPGTVMQVLAPGYMIHERLLRPAMVGVAKAPAADTDSAS
jgi:molecular chaperone GrpE